MPIYEFRCDKKHTSERVCPKGTQEITCEDEDCDLPATKIMSRCLTYMKADGFQLGMPKRPGMSGIDYGRRTWPVQTTARFFGKGGVVSQE